MKEKFLIAIDDFMCLIWGQRPEDEPRPDTINLAIFAAMIFALMFAAALKM